MNKDILTIEDLVQFCESNSLFQFSSKNDGPTIRVAVPCTFEEEETDDPLTLYGTVKVFHTGKNANGSSVTDEAALKVLPTMKYKPLLAGFTIDKDGNPDFTTHEKKIVKDKNGKNKTVYIERQIGCFTAKEPYIKYDEEHERNFIYAQVAIPRTYTPAADIIERKSGTKVSAEIDINEFSYDKESKVLVFSDIEFVGCTCLGVDPKTKKEIGEGMKGSKLTLEDFSSNENVSIERDEKLIQALEKLNTALSSFEINTKKGGEDTLDKFNELLAKYGKKADEITFAYDGLSDEELEKAFSEAFLEAPENPVQQPENTKETVPAKPSEFSKERKVTVTDGDGVIEEFSLSLSEIEYALDDLVNKTYSQIDGHYSNVTVYPDDSMVVFHAYGTRNHYRQSYERDGDSFKLVGERVSVHPSWLSDDEQTYLEGMKKDFSSLRDEIETYKKKEALEANKKIVSLEKFSAIADSKEVSDLVASAEFASMSQEDVTAKLNAIVVDHLASGRYADFAAKDTRKSPSYVRLPIKTTQKNSRYGGIFRNHTASTNYTEEN